MPRQFPTFHLLHSPSHSPHSSHFPSNMLNTTQQHAIDEGFTDAEEEPTPDLPPWLLGLQHEQRADFALSLLLTLPTAYIAKVSERLVPYLHRDFVTTLPSELCMQIFSFLSTRELLAAALVSKSWRRFALEPRLWRSLYFLNGWSVNVDRIGELEGMQDDCSDTPTCDDEETETALHAAMHDRLVAPIRKPLVRHPSVQLPVHLAAPRIDYPSSPSLPVTPRPDLYFHQGRLNWRYVYQQHHLLDQNWRNGNYTVESIPLPQQIGHSEGTYCIQFDSKKIVSGSRDKSIRVWDLETKECRLVLQGHQGSVLCLQFIGDEIVSGSSDSSIILWDIRTANIRRIFRNHTESVLNIRFDDRYIISCSKDRTIKVWDRNAVAGVDGVVYNCIRTLAGHRAAVNAVQFQKNRIVSASGDRTIRVWDLETGICLKTIEGHTRGIACIQFDGRFVVSGSSDRSIKVFDIENGDNVNTLEGHSDLVRTLQADQNRIVSGSYDETIRVWDAKNGKLVCDLRNGHSSRIFKLQYDARRIVSCSQDSKIVIWDFGAGVDSTLFS
ncbi:F-box/WD repeat-containing protein pof11 [Neolecta irregularis DAH-3]|uniref:F-box/WD repeat-containing protein pof11 n=1 Tax=Neolecta irregularis (strain DAH-3) TaxID=1198029 RepID=A0A1U7LHF7_NEOID|nr:F-box/WD repeat-containing protein pof11 [Neolecta irregularis DAH-3]|eukprot:OLL22079.1 F-box/WD repeat-containing protein pof11 [Neolecta irregularis DAH-3]